MSIINLPEGDHEAVLLGTHKEMVEQWSGVAVELDGEILKHFGSDIGHQLGEVLPVIAYAHIAKAAYGLSSTASIQNGKFDPEEFGRRCTEIAREQMRRYQQHHHSDFMEVGGG